MATTIRINDTPHPLHTTRSNEDTRSGDGNHDLRDFMQTTSSSSRIKTDRIFDMRALTRTFSRSSLGGRRGTHKGDKNEAEDDDPGLRQLGDFQSR